MARSTLAIADAIVACANAEGKFLTFDKERGREGYAVLRRGVRLRHMEFGRYDGVVVRATAVGYLGSLERVPSLTWTRTNP